VSQSDTVPYHMTQLTPNFNWREFLVSREGTAKGLSNRPPDRHLENAQETARHIALGLEKVRALLDSPINISSGYRSKSVNKLVGGVWNSYHRYTRYGRSALVGAVDIESPGVANVDLAKVCLETGLFYAVLLEFPTKHASGGWVHLSYDPKRQLKDGSKVRTVTKDSSGKTRYIPGLWERRA